MSEPVFLVLHSHLLVGVDGRELDSGWFSTVEMMSGLTVVERTELSHHGCC